MSDNNQALVLTSKTTTEALGWTQDDVAVIKATICVGATDAQLRLFLYTAKRLGLDPLARQIYSIPYQGKYTTQVGIDGFRTIAIRSGEYDGQDAAEWCGEDGKWKKEWLTKEPPVAARVSVYRKGIDRPFVGFARFEAYCQKKDGKPNSMWSTKGDNQLAKCAEALALRKAFPQDLAGVYTPEEMEHLENESSQPSTADKVRDALKKPKDGPVQDAIIEEAPKVEEPPKSGTLTLKVASIKVAEHGIFGVEFESGERFESPEQAIADTAHRLKGKWAVIEFVGKKLMVIEPAPEAATVEVDPKVEAEINDIFPQ